MKIPAEPTPEALLGRYFFCIKKDLPNVCGRSCVLMQCGVHEEYIGA